jgi:hypothetical protein
VAPPDLSSRDLEKRWGISRNGIKARARALGVELIRVSSTLTTWPGAFIELGERLHDHLQSGQPMGTFLGLTSRSAFSLGVSPTSSSERRVGVTAEAFIDVPWRMADTTGSRLFLQNRIG